jgi:hypothetical protein
MVFGNCRFPNDYFVRMAVGGAARFARSLPIPYKLTGWFMTRFRMGILMATKISE